MEQTKNSDSVAYRVKSVYKNNRAYCQQTSKPRQNSQKQGQDLPDFVRLEIRPIYSFR